MSEAWRRSGLLRAKFDTSVRVASSRSRDEARATPSSTPCVNALSPFSRRRSRSAARTSPRWSTRPPASSAARDTSNRFAALHGPVLRRRRRHGFAHACRPMPCRLVPSRRRRPRRARPRPSTWPAAARRSSSSRLLEFRAWSARGRDLQHRGFLGDVLRMRLPGFGWLLSHCGRAAAALPSAIVSNMRPRSRGS